MSVISFRSIQKFACALSALVLTTGTMLVTTATPSEAAIADPATARAWMEQAQAELDRNLHYPFTAMRQSRQGIARVSATVRPDGTLENIYVAQSTGDRALDRAALRAVEKLNKLPPLPGSQSPRQVEFQAGFGVALTPGQEADLTVAFKEQPATALSRAD